MRLGFQKLIAIPLAGLSEHEDLEDLNGSGSERATDGESKEREVDARPNAASTAAHADGLRHELKRRHKEAQNYMLTVTHNRVLAQSHKLERPTHISLSLSLSLWSCARFNQAARLIAPELKGGQDDPTFGYKLIIDALKPDHEQHIARAKESRVSEEGPRQRAISSLFSLSLAFQGL